MDRDELVVLIALVLFSAFLVGWILRWAYGSMRRVNSPNMGDVDDLANRLHEAELQKDQSQQELNDLEWTLKNKLSQSEAELQAAMEGLGEARREVHDLQSQLEDATKKLTKRKSKS